MVYRSWQIGAINEEKSQELSKNLNIQRILSDILIARGYDTNELAKEILVDDKSLQNPMEMYGMKEAVARILKAVDNGERIVVFGDYDVDGVTATALLYSYLDSIGAEVYYKLPTRSDDGYGLSLNLVREIAQKKVNLIITVDNGICECEAVEIANELGVDIVITDHHLAPETLPNAVAVVDPQIPQDNSEYKNLCGVGVAFMLACCIEGCKPEELLPFYADFAAIGTVADIMKLTGANRKIVKEGIEMLQNTQRPGLLALLMSCGLNDKELKAENISFGIAPRLNAAGRMDNATQALELLLCDDIEQAHEMVSALEEQNTARQKEEQEIIKDVLEKINADENYSKERILVVFAPNYHQGVIGIVASRVLETYGKPTIIISVDEKGEGKGSGRSAVGISLYNGIAACEDLLIRFGGHDLAAGLSIDKNNIAEFRKRINEWAKKEYPTLNYPPIKLDIEVKLDNLTEENLQEVSKLAPFGHANPSPLFLIKHAVIEAVYPVSDAKHSRLRINQNGFSFYAVIFGKSPSALAYKTGDKVDLAVSLSIYEGKNGNMISGRIKDIRPGGMSEKHLEHLALFEALNSGVQLSDGDKLTLKPERQDVIDVYKLTKVGINAQDLRVVFAKLGEERSGKILIALHALQELELIKQEEHSGEQIYIAIENAPKKDLQTAPIFSKLI